MAVGSTIATARSSVPICRETQGRRTPLVNLVVGNVVAAITWEKAKLGRRAPHQVCLICWICSKKHQITTKRRRSLQHVVIAQRRRRRNKENKTKEIRRKGRKGEGEEEEEEKKKKKLKRRKRKTNRGWRWKESSFSHHHWELKLPLRFGHKWGLACLAEGSR